MTRNKTARFAIRFNDQLKQGHSFEVSYREMNDSTPDKQFNRLLGELRKAGVLILREDSE